MSELIEMPYGSGKALERELVKKYEEVHINHFADVGKEEDIPNAEKRLLERYGIKENDT